MVSSEQQLAGILSTIAEGLIVQDADGRVHVAYTWFRKAIKHLSFELPRSS